MGVGSCYTTLLYNAVNMGFAGGAPDRAVRSCVYHELSGGNGRFSEGILGARSVC